MKNRPAKFNRLVKVNSEMFPGEHYLKVESPNGEILFVSGISSCRDFGADLAKVNELTSKPIIQKAA